MIRTDGISVKHSKQAVMNGEQAEMVTNMPTAHPLPAMLRDYANGCAPEGAALLVAAHLTYCADCRREVERFEALNAMMLTVEDEQMVNDAALDRVLARLDEPARDAPIVVRDAMLPGPVAQAFGRFEDIRWRFVMPGVSRCDLPSAGDEEISLLRVRPGVGVPAHTHTGVESTLVLCGALQDRGATYAKGDVAVADSADDHHPRAAAGADCVCLAVMTGSLRFTGPLGRALNIFAE